MNIQRYGTTRRYSHMAAHNNTIYLVEVAANLDADITAQTENLLANVEQQLIQANSDKSQLLSLVPISWHTTADLFIAAVGGTVRQ